MRRAEVVLRVIFWGAILAGVSMVAVAAGQEFREHNVESLSQYAPGGSGEEHNPGETVRVIGRVRSAKMVRGRLEITLEPVNKEAAARYNLFFTTEVVAVRWPWYKSAMPFDPRIGEKITVCGISRYDRAGYRWQVNPVIPCGKVAP